MNSLSAQDLHTCCISNILLFGARSPKLRQLSIRLALRWEEGEFFSRTAREIIMRYYSVEIGAYSYGACFVPNSFPRGTAIGRYVSIADGVRAFQRNHPVERISMHPFFYNSALGIVLEDNIPSGLLIIEHDVWIGHRAIITPGCHRIGLGAVVGAGTVVTRDVPPFSIIAGNPARIVRMRFEPDLCQAILESHWWEMNVNECRRQGTQFMESLKDREWLHKLATQRNG